jgi:hypothetical protein
MANFTKLSISEYEAALIITHLINRQMPNSGGDQDAANLATIMRFWIVTERVILKKPIMLAAVQTGANRRSDLDYLLAMDRIELFGNHGWCSCDCPCKRSCRLKMQFMGQSKRFAAAEQCFCFDWDHKAGSAFLGFSPTKGNFNPSQLLELYVFFGKAPFTHSPESAKRAVVLTLNTYFLPAASRAFAARISATL